LNTTGPLTFTPRKAAELDNKWCINCPKGGLIKC